MKRHSHEVIVGNIGTVYSGNSAVVAGEKFQTYAEQSETGRGRAGGEPVMWLEDGEIVKEHEGNLNDWEDRPGDE